MGGDRGRDHAEFAALCAVLGDQALPERPEFATAAQRERHRDELDVAIAARTRTHDKHVLADRLQAAGVAAAPVVNGRDLFADPHLRHRHWFTRLEHPVAGTHEYPGLPAILDGGRLTPRRASPSLGADTVDILHWLGYDDATIEELRGRGVVAVSAEVERPARQTVDLPTG